MKKPNRFITLGNEEMNYCFLPSGDIYTFHGGKILLNQFRGNLKDGSVNNIWLRLFQDKKTLVFPLLGIRSSSNLSVTDHALRFTGQIEDISYTVTFTFSGHAWFWEVTLRGNAQAYDLIYGQDIGLAFESAIYTNELYNSQYLDHAVFESSKGSVICTRQNMACDDTYPYLQQGLLKNKAVSYSTDGLQFFGLTAKEGKLPKACLEGLENRKLQYEFAYSALQTEKHALSGEDTTVFYTLFHSNHPDAVQEIEYQEELQAEWKNCCAFLSVVDAPFTACDNLKVKAAFGAPICSDSISSKELEKFYPDRILEEYSDHTLLSFFTPDHAHVVTKEKEQKTERPHGTIIITPPDTEKPNSRLVSSTQYMYGIFNSHVVIGNTDMHKFLSTPRGFLNLLTNSGQRLYVFLNNQWHLLTLPALFEMGMNYSRWYYKFNNDVLRVTSYTHTESPEITLEAESLGKIPYDFLLTQQLVMGTHEYSHDIEYTKIEDGLRFSLNSPEYPGLHYDLVAPDQNFTISDDRIFFTDDRPFDETFLTLEFHRQEKLLITILASLDGSTTASDRQDFETEKSKGILYYQEMTRHFHLENCPEKQHERILNETVWWYTHNALIHYAMPHGLEQPGGAAWGTRDVCQGPAEFFLSTQHYSLARNTLLNIFAHQDIHTSEWPQWFMFDRYHMNPGECHGDIIFWPLKYIADYLQSTGDNSILNENVPYENAPDQMESLTDHIRRCVDVVEEQRMIKDTGLITYAGGDWDDTLQPAKEEMKKNLVSAWTVALACQTFSSLSLALADSEPTLSDRLEKDAQKIQSGFSEHLIHDDVIAGFLDCSGSGHFLLHPSDTETGIHYRLLPLTRSIIAGIVSKEQADQNRKLILDHLRFPDGVRLMDRPARYDGGVSHLFKRAEQAANVGREISLQYTHAHIRFLEAMAALGDAEHAWYGLFTINPIHLQDTVPNARLRQSNMYFSSSDGAFPDRYEYARGFDTLRTGETEVKGGWRLYSSGPGIYLHQLIGNILGIRFCAEGLIIDPVLPAALDGTTLTYDCFGKTLHFCYHFTDTDILSVTSDGNLLDTQPAENTYRTPGVLITKDVLNSCGEVLHLYLPKKG